VCVCVCVKVCARACSQFILPDIFLVHMDALDGEQTSCCLGGVMVRVIAITSKVRGFNTGRGDGFLREIKSAARLSSKGKKSRMIHVVSSMSC
jgi:hypothetical protein